MLKLKEIEERRRALLAMDTIFQWTLIWEETHGENEEDAVRTQLQEAFDSGSLSICPRCRAMEARISSDLAKKEFHAFIACTCLLRDPQKWPAQTMDSS